jgi:stage II sporulation protein GA (sporulation sigma-E factor processing peptidase)
MVLYADLAAILNFMVDFLLILATNRLCGFPIRVKRALAAAALGGGYAFTCLMPGFAFLGNPLWLMVCLGGMIAISFGLDLRALRRGCVFVLLSFSLAGIAVGMNRYSFWWLLVSAAGVWLICALLPGMSEPNRRYVPVILSAGERRICLTALHDTGNTLRDPVTGESVLIAGPEAAEKLLGIPQEKLRCPVDTVAEGLFPGLRLIPYRAVGQSGGMLWLRGSHRQ